MYWNYRILKKGNTFEVVEVYYDENNKPMAYTDCKNELKDESVENLFNTVKYLYGDIKRSKKDVLTLKDFKGKGWDKYLKDEGGKTVDTKLKK
ncbi:MAG: hypothetical protein PHP92_03785 [Candidatus Nanoarchaeia archaeon]|nr:hypothetical protein [Candidatus Nanoarchaeia archaeon]